jgi:hypothetical protein
LNRKPLVQTTSVRNHSTTLPPRAYFSCFLAFLASKILTKVQTHLANSSWKSLIKILIKSGLCWKAFDYIVFLFIKQGSNVSHVTCEVQSGLNPINKIIKSEKILDKVRKLKIYDCVRKARKIFKLMSWLG